MGRKGDIVPLSSHDAAIAALAVKQHGNVTRAQLLELGLNRDLIRWRIKSGRLFRVHRGVYAVGRRPVSAHELLSAAVLACGPGAALSHSSAMVLWDYWNRLERPLEVTVVGDRRLPGIRIRRSKTLTRHDITVQHGIRVTSPARTVIDMEPRFDDKALKRTVNKALHSLWLTESQLEEALQRNPSRRIATLLGLPGTPTRSAWEDDFPDFCRRYGLPAPVMGAPLCGYIVDALFLAQRVIVELDSVEFHRDPIAFETDRERDAVTLENGFVTVRITSARLAGQPAVEAQRLRAILARQAPRAA